MEEIWKDISGYEGLYQVSNFGRIKSLERKSLSGTFYITIKEKILKPSVSRGYESVCVSMGGKVKRKIVHRVVAQTFIDNPENKLEVNHIDGNKRNNIITNLEWCTRLENTKHSYINFLTPRGSKRGHSKITESDAYWIKYNSAGLSQHKIAKKYGINQSTVSEILKGGSWKHI